MDELLKEILAQHEISKWTAEATLDEVCRRCPKARVGDPDRIKDTVRSSFKRNGGLTGIQLVEMVMDLARPGIRLKDHPTFKRVFDADCDAAFKIAENGCRHPEAFAETLFQSIVLGNCHVVLQTAQKRIFDIIGHDKRCETSDAFYSASDVWCIASGKEATCKYRDGGKAIHGWAISPCGWLRLALKVDQGDWEDWHRAYHGTVGKNLSSIIDIGLKHGEGEHGTAGMIAGRPVIYCSPSIEYAAHYLYAGEEQQIKAGAGSPSKAGGAAWEESLVGNVLCAEDAHAQFVFEVRVRPGSYRVQGNTLHSSLWPDHDLGSERLPFESRCMSENLEWLVEKRSDIICTGVMLRTLRGGPREYNQQRINEMMKHVGWDAEQRRCTRPRSYGGVKAGARAVWEYNGAAGGTLSYQDSGDWVRYSDEHSAIIESAYQRYQRFAFLGTPPGAPGPYIVDFGRECDATLAHYPEQRRADADREQTWRRRAVRRRAA